MAFVNCRSIFFFVSFALMVPALQATVRDMTEEYWQIKAKEAMRMAQETYEPNPELITKHVNKKVAEVLTGVNGTRRILKKEKTGGCQAFNPIDQCWRCRPDWMENRKKLAECVIGFGHKTTGGKNGNFYVVTDPSDNDMAHPKPGTLRHAVTQDEPLWIIFDRPMIIKLNQELLMTSNKTIDARGANVHIAHGAGITLQFVDNVIIHGLHIHDIVPGSGGIIADAAHHLGLRTRSDGDGISIYSSTNIWIDHVSMSNCSDGIIDIIMGSTGITISNGHFTKHNDVMLFGANDEHTQDTIMQVTVAFNHFGKGLIQRMPRARYGFVHVVNNDYTHWLMYAIGGSSHPTIISQGNRFIAPNDPNVKQVTKREAPESVWKSWQWRSEGDMFINGAYFLESGQPRTENKFTSQEFIEAKTVNFVGEMTRDAGPLGCKQGQPC